MKLSERFEAGGHWPSLKQLKLRALQATDISLIKLSTTHATTLRSLELAYIGLLHYQLDGKECHGSWVEIILTLQSHLCLQTVRLDGNLSNGWNEGWSAVDHNKSDDWHFVGERPEEVPCLKHRVERYVVEGGTCPLPLPYHAEESGGWKCIDFGVDSSWRFRP